MQHLHSFLFKSMKSFLDFIFFILITLPKLSSSKEVGISEYSRGAPYIFIKHGPNVGRNP